MPRGFTNNRLVNDKFTNDRPANNRLANDRPVNDRNADKRSVNRRLLSSFMAVVLCFSTVLAAGAEAAVLKPSGAREKVFSVASIAAEELQREAEPFGVGAFRGEAAVQGRQETMVFSARMGEAEEAAADPKAGAAFHPYTFEVNAQNEVKASVQMEPALMGIANGGASAASEVTADRESVAAKDGREELMYDGAALAADADSDAESPAYSGELDDSDPWEKSDSLPNQTGSYYLEADVILDKYWEIPDNAVISLDLRDHHITSNDTYAIYVPKNATLNLYGTGGGKIVDTAIGSAGTPACCIYTEGIVNLFGNNVYKNRGNDEAPASCIFSNGTVNMYGGTVSTVNGTGIRGIYSTGTLNIVNATISGSNYGGKGGAIYAGNANVTINNVTFSESMAGEGGAIYAGNNSHVSISNATFNGSWAQKGGAIYADSSSSVDIDEVTFDGNRAFNEGEGGLGGALYFDSTGSSIIRNVNFTSNEALEGGAIYFNRLKSDITIINATFQGNQAVNEGEGGIGGAIYLNDGSGIDVYNSTFENNTALREGIVYLKDGSDITINQTNFTYNTALRDGIVYLTNASSIVLNNTIFTDNMVSGGGTIYSRANSSVSLTGSSFEGNVVHGSIGGVQSSGSMAGFLYTDGGGAVEITGNRFIGEKDGASGLFSMGSNVNYRFRDNVFLPDFMFFNNHSDNQNFTIEQNFFGNLEDKAIVKPACGNANITAWYFMRPVREIDESTGQYRLSAQPCLFDMNGQNHITMIDPDEYRLPEITLDGIVQGAVFRGSAVNNTAVLSLNKLDYSSADFDLSLKNGTFQYSVGLKEPLSGETTSRTYTRSFTLENDRSQFGNYTSLSNNSTIPIVNQSAELRIEAVETCDHALPGENDTTILPASVIRGKEVSVSLYTSEGSSAGNFTSAISEDGGFRLNLGNMVNRGIYNATIEVDGFKPLNTQLTFGSPIPEISPAPTAAAITFGQALKDSALTGGEAKYNGTEVAGSFAWADDTIRPAVSDSGKTNYTVVFTPGNSTEYAAAETNVTLTVNKASDPVTVNTTAVSVMRGGYTTDLSDLISGTKDYYNGTVSYGIGVDSTGGGCEVDSDSGVFTSGNKTGECTVIVTAADDGNYQEASYTVNVTVTDKQQQTISFPQSSLTKSFGDEDFTFEAVRTVGDGLVSYDIVNGTDVVTVDGDSGLVHILKAGLAVIRATAAETQSFEAASDVYVLTVNKTEPGGGTHGEGSLAYNGEAQELVTGGSVMGGTLLYAIGDNALDAPTEGWSEEVPSGTGAGTYYVWYRVDGDENHNSIDPACISVEIAKAEITIAAQNKKSTRGEALQKLTCKVSGAYVSGDKLGIKLTTGAKKNAKAGKYPVYVSWNGNPNYAATLKEGTYTLADAVTSVEKKAAKIRMNAGFLVTWDEKGVLAKWGSASDVQRYLVYAAYCGKTTTCKKVGTVEAGASSFLLPNLKGKTLNVRRGVKLYVRAQRKVNGKWTTVADTIMAHVVSPENRIYSNAAAVTASKDSFKLKIGKTAKITAKEILADKKKASLGKNHAARFRYASGNSKVAKVDKDGIITAAGRGTCTIFVYARNGRSKRITVTVE